MARFSDQFGLNPVRPGYPESMYKHPKREIRKDVPYKRIAVEEAWSFPALNEAQARLIQCAARPDDPGLMLLAKMFLENEEFQKEMCDLGDGRLARMDELGIDRQLLLLTSPGVQPLETAVATEMAAMSNDILAEACRRHPTRYSGLLSFAAQDVPAAVKEIERGMQKLGLSGAVINSNTKGRYLDEPEFLPLLEALEANNAPLYIHPNFMPRPTFNAYEYRALPNASFTHEVWIHVMGLIMAGVFDEFPNLKVVIGHLGEALPLHLYRLDWWQGSGDGIPGTRGGMPAKPLKRRVSDYFKSNIWITTSGVGWEPAIQFCQKVMGPDRVLYAMDYPYQADPDEVAAYDEMDMPDEWKMMLMQTNAEKLFNIK